uniref:Uncharacterized protein n=1 Tax=Haemonchus contortus TaxID=6289 RepID=A0A7I4YGN4_HAECO
MWSRLFIVLLIFLLIDEATPKLGQEKGGSSGEVQEVNGGTELERSPRSWALRRLPQHRRPRLRSPPRRRMPTRRRRFEGRPHPKPARPSKRHAGAARDFRV